MYVVGVTGGIGSGKSTVCRVLAERFQIPFIYVDKISREIVQPGMPLNVEIREVFGDEAMLSDGNINRAYFRAMIIADPEQKALVDKTFYPHMKNEIDRKLANLKENGFLVVGIENAMMIEFGATSYVNKVVVVACSEESQLRRVMERDNQTEESARGMMKLQMPLEEKRKHADLVITNDGTLAELRDQINSLYESLPRIK
jgi:dephospho-CoA kinase